MTGLSTLPVWAQIGSVLIPILAAIVAGAFALANGKKRPIDRIEQLVKIVKDMPDGLDNGNVMRRQIRLQLSLVEVRQSSPYNHLIFTTPLYIIFMIGMAAGVAWALHLQSAKMLLTFAAAGLAFTIFYCFLCIRFIFLGIAPLAFQYSDVFEEINERFGEYRVAFPKKNPDRRFGGRSIILLRRAAPKQQPDEAVEPTNPG